MVKHVGPLGMVLLLLPTGVFAQAASANLTGTVKDTSGGVLPGVSISARNVGTNETRTTLTESDGLYRLTNLPRGTYEVKADLQGFKTLAQANVLVTVGDTVRLDFTMDVGTVAETVEVQGHAALVNTEEGRLSYLVDEKRVAELPLNGRNAFQLMERQPGASSNPGNAVLGGSAGGNTAFVNGQSNRANNFLLDGSDNNDLFTAGRTAVNPNVVSSRIRRSSGPAQASRTTGTPRRGERASTNPPTAATPGRPWASPTPTISGRSRSIRGTRTSCTWRRSDTCGDRTRSAVCSKR